MNLEKMVAKGANNEVFKDGDAAVKLFREGYPKADVLAEALIAARVEDTTLNIPNIREISVVNGRWAISMDYIEGKTLAQLMEEDPDNIEKYVDLMVELQLEMHSQKCPNLHKLKDKLNARINLLDKIDDSRKYELLTILDGTPKHKKLCHGDFNPRNIIVSDNKNYIIDWNHATIGNASADVARSFLWLSLYNEKIADMYMDKFCEASGTDKIYVQQWLPVIAAARLYNNIEEEKELLLRWIDVIEYQ